MQMKRKPKFGQNFLVDDAARHAIVDALGDISKRTVIEIGPGHGAITEILAGRCRRLIALELDRALAAELTFRFRDQPQVQIIEADVLKADLRALVPNGETADVIGNLPYYITSDILLQLFAAGSAGLITRAVLMMQREVADRVAAAPGVRDYGLLSATTQMNAQVDNLFTLLHRAAVAVCAAVCRARRRCWGIQQLFAAVLCTKAKDAAKQPARRRIFRRRALRVVAGEHSRTGSRGIVGVGANGGAVPLFGENRNSCCRRYASVAATAQSLLVATTGYFGETAGAVGVV